MTTKKKTPQIPRDTVNIKQHKDEDPDEALSKTLCYPETQAALTIQKLQPIHKVDALATILFKQSDEIAKGNMTRPEAMLMSQAHTLDELFNTLARRAALNMGEHMSAAETYFRLALKAQSQCRATLETLSAIKNPPVIFAKQANISTGNQQINNGESVPRTQENKNQHNELLEHTHGERLDFREKSTASCIDSKLAAVE